MKEQQQMREASGERDHLTLSSVQDYGKCGNSIGRFALSIRVKDYLSCQTTYVHGTCSYSRINFTAVFDKTSRV
jgi:hypothetical protein